MGISTVASYTGAQVFEAVGLGQEFVDEYFTGTTSRLGGVGLDVIAEEVAARHRQAYPPTHAPTRHRELDVGGEYQWRREGELPPLQPGDGVQAAALDAHAAATTCSRSTPRGRRAVRAADDAARAVRVRRPSATPIPIDEVEPVSEIVKRFNTGAMSYGSISQEAHETLAIAMNRLGGALQHR